MNKPRSPNRRRSLRQPSKTNSKVTCFGGKLGLGPNIAVKILDLSETGIRLRVTAACEPGYDLKVHLSSLAHRKPVILEGNVVWCVPTTENDYCIGVEFVKPLNYRDLQLLSRG